ncbi:hypothetical protein [Vibrio sp. Isolate24]|uniref:hypothetical protein n=1 Tax=Vibrio sp. Isolate24 TaxID=2908534 RepID=UPI001EFD7357|nr:hypothetical protein [Vibrio sp. Isolate24]MCG9678947.1 hypothetical protein [Vibrio sp. Isolate24]
MAKVNLFHSKMPGTAVYHDESTCDVGNNIETRNKQKGTGGKRKCARCKEIQAK